MGRRRPPMWRSSWTATAAGRKAEACPDLDISHLTLFAVSTENWKRPAIEVQGLMRLFRRYIKKEGARLVAEGVRVRFIGGRERLDADLQALMAGLEAQTET